MSAFSSVNKFLGKFEGGARPNRFRVRISGPQAGAIIPEEKFSFMCHAASIPESNLGRCDVAYMGRIVKVAGDREFGDWTVSVYNDTVWDLRAEFEFWSNGMLENEGNIAQRQNAVEYLAQAKVEQLDRQEQVIQTYNIESIFPISIGAIQLGYDQNNSVETFDVTFAVNWWTSDSTTSALPAGSV